MYKRCTRKKSDICFSLQYRVSQKYCNSFYVAYISAWVNDNILNFFSRSCALNSSTKTVWSNSFCLFWWFFLYLDWTTYMTVSLPIKEKIFWQLFWFAIGFGIYKFCRAVDCTSFKNKFNIPWFFQVEIDAKQNNLPNVFNMMGSDTDI